MHIAINGYFWDRPDTGSGQYTRQLVYHFNRLVSDLAITLIWPRLPDGPDAPADVPPSVNVAPVPVRAGQLGKVWFEQAQFPDACRGVGADLAHVPYWGAPLRCTMPVVVTVHDLTTELVREYRRRPTARLYNALVAAAARGAAHVITDSHSSRVDVIDHLGVPDERVTAIYLGVDERFTTESEFLLDMAVQQKYGLDDFYILYLGGYALHKNVTTLLLAYTYVSQALGEDYPLILAGKRPEPGGTTPDYAGYIEELGLSERVRWIGYVDEEDKPALYRQASCFVFPSRMEGFGLPPLEAMACGVPVVTTDAGSLPEVVEDAAFAVNPDDARDMAGAIIATVIQDDLAQNLRDKGPRQAARFTWEATVRETLEVYAEVLAA